MSSVQRTSKNLKFNLINLSTCDVKVKKSLWSVQSPQVVCVCRPPVVYLVEGISCTGSSVSQGNPVWRDLVVYLVSVQIVSYNIVLYFYVSKPIKKYYRSRYLTSLNSMWTSQYFWLYSRTDTTVGHTVSRKKGLYKRTLKMVLGRVKVS